MKKPLTIKFSEGELLVLNQILTDILKAKILFNRLPPSVEDNEKEFSDLVHSVSDCVHSNGLCDDPKCPNTKVIEF